jgi:hypothetical protein
MIKVPIPSRNKTKNTLNTTENKRKLNGVLKIIKGRTHSLLKLLGKIIKNFFI